jgi:hypothetical protein
MKQAANHQKLRARARPPAPHRRQYTARPTLPREAVQPQQGLRARLRAVHGEDSGRKQSKLKEGEPCRGRRPIGAPLFATRKLKIRLLAMLEGLHRLSLGRSSDHGHLTVFGILLIVLMFLMTTGNVGGVCMVMRR